MRKSIRRLVPYWLRGGDRTCTGCGNTHAYAVEARCVACDRAYCPTCVFLVAGEPFCSDCHDEEKKPKGGRSWRRARSGKA
ncbi:MAG TPA: hypothetical protein VF824_03750 [Thermoanaerobaculia bacterium]